jgi:hypothetical protein
MERSIIFSSEMVRAILDGRKTQTRRVIKPQPNGFTDGIAWIYEDVEIANKDFTITVIKNKYIKRLSCPYEIGMKLWVREKWRIVGWAEGKPLLLEYFDGVKAEEPGDSSNYDEEKYCQYFIDCSDDCERAGLVPDENGYYSCLGNNIPTRWRPSIHMPRWASRLTLEIINVRVERVQDISEEDAIAEGVQKEFEIDLSQFRNLNTNFGDISTYKLGFKHLWNSINLERGFGWDSNPWVWVIEFKRIEN